VEARRWHWASPRRRLLTEWVAQRGGSEGGAGNDVLSLVGSSGGRRRVPTVPAARQEGGEAEERFA
jgi:hypothetical protein